MKIKLKLKHKPKSFGGLVDINTSFLDKKPTIKMMYSQIYDYTIFHKSLRGNKLDRSIAKELLKNADDLIKKMAVIEKNTISDEAQPHMDIPRSLRMRWGRIGEKTESLPITEKNIEKLLSEIRIELHILTRRELKRGGGKKYLPNRLLIINAIEETRSRASSLVNRINVSSLQPEDDIYRLVNDKVDEPLSMLWEVYATAYVDGIGSDAGEHSADNILNILLGYINDSMVATENKISSPECEDWRLSGKDIELLNFVKEVIKSKDYIEDVFGITTLAAA